MTYYQSVNIHNVVNSQRYATIEEAIEEGVKRNVDPAGRVIDNAGNTVAEVGREANNEGVEVRNADIQKMYHELREAQRMVYAAVRGEDDIVDAAERLNAAVEAIDKWLCMGGILRLGAA